jgi:hypothetical protein
MKSGKVQINDLRIKVPGVKPGQARRLGEMVADRLADSRLAGQTSKSIGSANVRLRSSEHSSIETMANEIVARIRSKIS